MSLSRGFMYSAIPSSEAMLGAQGPYASLGKAVHVSHQNDVLDKSKIFVVSLPRRHDRREQMERLRSYLGLQWTYWDAVEAEDERISTILDKVYSLRSEAANLSIDTISERIRLPFQWPSNIDTLARSNVSLAAAEASFWTLPPSSSFAKQDTTRPPLTCAIADFTILPYADASEHKILNAPRVACWDSHLSVIKEIAKLEKGTFGVILEDDVDLEKDIRRRLNRVWTYLPEDWDMVHLGHCWGNETYYPALSPPASSTESQLHPSKKPKCTHAYAVSPIGARRLLLYLTHPPFTYSRAIDQAYTWLIKKERIKSFSIVPSVAVQTKNGLSDISKEKPSVWKETLIDGVFRT
ncbi:uncharacterized protein EV420DRAFT_892284 [Desarmillaria tabescens]|uniref:Glycosyl transferase family 25 domain-containing protein n=1 Tax=Armillaria tabescens TaxID=1929756 RepID=A0AA39JPG5_ARMTA|nr:uncharacterized protein EV420DRAFT_892284 [Desarmillaria tabescens]KAK0446527.1 hypothetical protein EV420DRAFT_892284 [Desarmillaria tabescens]